MDNRRVAKAYRDRSSKVKVLPYPTRGGLFSSVKRYLSRSASQTMSQESTPQPAQPSNTTFTKPEQSFALPESLVTANSTIVQGSEDSNRVLSTFFHEKGNAPLSQVEYEGVISLLERSKASITLPLPELTPEKPPVRSVSRLHNGNNTFAQYSQSVLRNSSMHDPNSSSFLAPDYKPTYHTFNESSRNGTSLKRVYQFSGLPSPYRTRIKAPNLAARKARRVASTQTPLAANSEVSNSTFDLVSAKPRSKAATSLLSILDRNEKDALATSSMPESRPLHNAYFKGKSLAAKASSNSKQTTMNAEDISKTMAFNKAEELGADKTSSNSLFDSPAATSVEKTAKTVLAEPKLISDLAPKMATENSKSGTDTDSFASKNTELQPTSSSGFDFSIFKSSKDAPRAGIDANASLSKTKTPVDSKEKSHATGLNFTSQSGLFGSNEESSKNPNNGKAALKFGSLEKPISSRTNQFGLLEEVLAAVHGEASSKAEAEIGKPSFAFKPQEPQSTELFGSAKKDKADIKPLFSFGKSAEALTNSKAPAETQAFGFGSFSEKSQNSTNLGANIEKNSDNGPVAKLNFGAFQSSKLKENPAPLFPEKNEHQTALALFGAPSSNFSFGTKPQALPSNSKAADAEQPANAPSFNFGPKASAATSNLFSATSNEKKPSGTSGFTTSDQSKQAFKFGSGFGADKNNLSSISGVLNENDGSESSAKPAEQAPLFSFSSIKGSGSSDKSAEQAPLFSFGSKNGSELSARPAEQKPLFSFGSENNTSSVSKPEATATTTFSVPKTGVEEDKKAPSAPLFQFGTKTLNQSKTLPSKTIDTPKEISTETASNDQNESLSNSSSETQKPKFQFGNSFQENNAFGFGKKPLSDSSEKPAFAFGTKSSADSKGAFNFGSQNADQSTGKLEIKKPASEAKPAFSFGSFSQTKPAFKFGEETQSKPALKFGEETQSKPTFNFGALTEAKPAFSFGNLTENASKPKPVFNFGSVSEKGPEAFKSSADLTEPAKFSFGQNASSQSTEPKKFNFGQTLASETKSETNGASQTKEDAEFEFPEVKVDGVVPEESKVTEYEKLFEF